jgi:hypothetical protein
VRLLIYSACYSAPYIRTVHAFRDEEKLNLAGVGFWRAGPARDLVFWYASVTAGEEERNFHRGQDDG